MAIGYLVIVVMSFLVSVGMLTHNIVTNNVPFVVLWMMLVIANSYTLVKLYKDIKENHE